jgi:hypothetical protein
VVVVVAGGGVVTTHPARPRNTNGSDNEIRMEHSLMNMVKDSHHIVGRPAFVRHATVMNVTLP